MDRADVLLFEPRSVELRCGRYRTRDSNQVIGEWRASTMCMRFELAQATVEVAMKGSTADVMRKLQGCQRAGCVSGQRPVRIPVVVVWASPCKDHEPANMVFEAERSARRAWRG
jgi:hypothetical protein